MFLLYGVALFLPLSLEVNNVLLFAFVVIYMLEGEWNFKFRNIKQYSRYLLPFLLLFLSVCIGLFNSYYKDEAIGLLERSLPLLLLPLIMLSDPEVFERHKKNIFISLAIGCLIAALICWSGLFLEAFNTGSIGQVFSWRSSRQNVTRILDIHPAYMSIFLYTAIGHLAQQYFGKQKKDTLRFKYVAAMVILILFLFQLLSRTALLYFMLASLFFLVSKRNIKWLFSYLAFIALIGVTIFYGLEDKSQYFERILFKETGITGQENLDKRFERWRVLIDLYAEKPILGHGTGDVEIIRALKFKEHNDLIAYKNKYNAHNQYIESLVAQGALGFLTLLLALGLLIYICVRSKKFFFLYLLLGFVICALTESLLQRSWGVVYFSLIAGMLLAVHLKDLAPLHESDYKPTI